MMINYLSGVNAAVRAAARGPLPLVLEEAHSFVFDLGFDSLSMVRLSLTLEEQFGYAILLDPWLSSQSDPAELTIRSLCDFLRSRLPADARAAS
jgi:acyl carrier protein